MLKVLKDYWLLGLIFLLALFLRTYNLSSIPAGIHGDEASVGYNAYSLLKTGKDQNGNFLPLAIDQFGDFRPAGIHYLDVPFVAVLGLNEFSTRFPSSLFGALTVIAMYFLLWEIFERKSISYLGSFLVAISPWHINISRATSEGIVAAFFIVVGVTLLLKALKNNKAMSPLSSKKSERRFVLNSSFSILCLSFFCFAISFLFYHDARFFVPVMLIPLLPLAFLYWKSSKRIVISSLVGTGLLFGLLFFLLTVGGGSYRALDVSLLTVPGGTQQVKQQQDEEGTLNPVINRFLHNKLIFYGQLFLTNYGMHFSPDFLFVNTGNPPRYKIPWTGNVNVVELPFILIGFAILLTEGLKQKKYNYLFPILWLFIAAIPAGLTWEDIPNVERASLMIFGLVAISSFGFFEVLNFFPKRLKTLVVVVVGLILVQNFMYFADNYFIHSRIHEPWYRSAAEKDLLTTVVGLMPKYNKVIMTTEHNNNFIFYLYYEKFDPKTFQKLGSPREHEGLQFGKLVYTYQTCPLNGDPTISLKVEPILYVDKESCTLPKNANVLQTVYTPDGSPAFKVVALQ